MAAPSAAGEALQQTLAGIAVEGERGGDADQRQRGEDRFGTAGEQDSGDQQRADESQQSGKRVDTGAK
ncbi:MAG: hypothetical protein U0R71_17390 [Solirubrobacterales bacterium]